MASNGSFDPGSKSELSNGDSAGVHQVSNVDEQIEENERKERVNAAWEKMNSGMSVKLPKSFMNKSSSTVTKGTPKTTHDWMGALGLVPKKTSSGQDMLGKRPANVQNGSSEGDKRIAAAALSAVREVNSANATTGRGKVEITEVQDFAGEDVEVKKLVDADSEAAEKAKVSGTPSSALDSILEQIKKKPKLSVLSKTKKDWGEFKEDKGLEDELDAYKKSSNQYLDKVSFLQRTDLREFERERDARLASQAKRRTDMREDDF